MIIMFDFSSGLLFTFEFSGSAKSLSSLETIIFQCPEMQLLKDYSS